MPDESDLAGLVASVSYDFLFFLGIFAPDLRASLRATATACLRLLNFLPLPDFSVPSLCSFMTLWAFLLLAESDDDAFFAMFRRPLMTYACPNGGAFGWRLAGCGLPAGGRRCRRIRTAVRFCHHRVFGVAGNPVFQKLFLAGEHALSQGLEIDIQLSGLRQHLCFFLPDVVTDAFRENGTFASR